MLYTKFVQNNLYMKCLELLIEFGTFIMLDKFVKRPLVKLCRGQGMVPGFRQGEGQKASFGPEEYYI